MVTTKGTGFSPYRLLFVIAGILALLGGLWAGLWRAGWNLPILSSTLPASHGPLMISGFLGIVISLERAVALKRWWYYLAPGLVAAGMVLFIILHLTSIGILFITLVSLVLSIAFFSIYRRDPALHYIVMGLGANTWIVGNLLWLRGFGIIDLLPWWIAFLLLTVIGERIELNRLLQLKRKILLTFGVILGIYIIGIISSLFFRVIGWRIMGFGLAGLALWLLRYDMAKRSIRLQGLSRFMGLALYLGYCWLIFAGLLMIWKGAVTGGYWYDAMLHSIFLGCVFSMIFGHAPVIFPVVLKLPVAFRPSFYFHLGLLHLSLLIRIAGDFAQIEPLRKWGSLLNAIAILLFLYNTVTSIFDKQLSDTTTPK